MVKERPDTKDNTLKLMREAIEASRSVSDRLAALVDDLEREADDDEH